jgi:predicted kinase
VQGEVNRILSGQRMAPSLRQSFRNEATNIYNNQRNSTEQTAERYRGLAESYGLNPTRVVVETPDERYERWKRSQGKK